MKTKFRITWSVIAWCVFLCTFTACSWGLTEVEQESMMGGVKTSSDNLLMLKVGVAEVYEENANTRGADVTSSNLSSIGLIGQKKLLDGTFSTPSDYIDNGEVTKGLTEFWGTPYSWPTTDEISLYAYAPYNAAGLSYSSSSSKNIPHLVYSVPVESANQKDLIVAYAENQVRVNHDAIPLDFEHICAKIIVCIGNNPYNGKTIKRISFVNIYTTGDYYFGTGWQNVEGSALGTVSNTRDFATAGQVNLDVTSGEYQFMMIPQELPGTASLVIEYTDNTLDTRSIKSDTEKWEAGETYRYSLQSTISLFTYKKGIQTYTAPYTGTYKLEVWGAQGATQTYNPPGGRGGYSYGNVKLSKGDVLYVVVGGMGTQSSSNPKFQSGTGGYNGGGDGQRGGGGATHIATVTGVLSSLSGNKPAVLIVAGGGGSADIPAVKSGVGGGTSGGNAISSGSTVSAYGGTQTAGGRGYANKSPGNGSFGKGGQASSSGNDSAGAGGGGWYGGGSSMTATGSPGGGGSGYIGNSLLLTPKATIAGDQSFVSPTSTANETGHPGNGYARITLVSKD